MLFCTTLPILRARKLHKKSADFRHTLSGSPQAEYTMTKSAPYVVQTQ